MTIVEEEIRFRVRGGTASDLATVNEIPLERELVIEIDTRNFKLGDGVTQYNDLPYATAEAFLQFQVTAEHVLQYRLSPDGPWVDVVDLDAYAGITDAPSDGNQYARKDGGWVEVEASGADSVQMRVESGYIQYSADGGTTWQDLIAESSLKGASAYEVAVANGFSGSESEWLASLKGEPGADAVGAVSRTTVTINSGSGSVMLGKLVLLLQLVTSAAARCRFYSTAGARDADASRAANVAAAQGAGLLLEFISTSAFLGAPLTPGVIAYNLDSPVNGSIYYNIQPVGSAMTVDLTYLKLES